jgi:two-component system nitrate/nitrite response regulator NarL
MTSAFGQTGVCLIPNGWPSLVRLSHLYNTHMPSTRGDAAAIDERGRVATIDVVIADDHPLVLDGLEHLLRRETDMNVVGRATSAFEAIEMVVSKAPSILLVDLQLGGENGLGVIRALRGRSNTRFVIMAGEIGEDEAIEALRLGVHGMLLKTLPSALIIKCLRKVHEGGRWIENASNGRAMDRLLHLNDRSARHPSGLSPRELEITRLIGLGLRNRTIAERLSITEATVKIHLHNIFVKLNVRSRLDLALKVQAGQFS